MGERVYCWIIIDYHNILLIYLKSSFLKPPYIPAPYSLLFWLAPKHQNSLMRYRYFIKLHFLNEHYKNSPYCRKLVENFHSTYLIDDNPYVF